MQENKNAIILLPSYQPEETLVALSKGLKEEGFKILIVDDGSGETYLPIFDRCKEFAEVLSYPKNKGKGGALKYGFSYILENYKDCGHVITADGDGQHRIIDIVRVYEKAIEKNTPIIAERKFDVPVPWKSKLGNSLSRFTQALCTYRYMRDNQCGLRSFPMSTLPSLIKISGMRYEYEMKVLTYLQAKEITYYTIPVQAIYEDNNRTTHFRPLQDTLLIQSSILVKGLVNLIVFLLGVLSASLFYYLLFREGKPLETYISYELSILLASPVTLLFHVIFNAIAYRPKSLSKMMFRLVLYEIIMLISELITVSFFCRVCNFTIYGAYLLCFPLTVFPLYYLIKGVGLVYSSQNS